MQYIFNLPTRPPLYTADDIIAIVRKGEELGFDAMSAADHIAPPSWPKTRYPYAQEGDSGDAQWGDSSPVIEMFTLLSFLAGLSLEMRIISIVLVLPFRNPVLMAKMLTTIDVLSKGRLTVGVGVGWEREEFETLSTPPFEERGKVGDEYIEFFRAMWTDEMPDFDGAYAKYTGSTFLPKPVQPCPPIWIGGESGPAMRRAARLGDGWLPVGISPTNPLDTPERYAVGVQKVRDMAKEQYGRDPSEIEMAYNVIWYDDKEETILDNGQRRMFTGKSRQIAEDITRMEEAGLQQLCLWLERPNLQDTLDMLDRFANEVRPHVGT